MSLLRISYRVTAPTQHLSLTSNTNDHVFLGRVYAVDILTHSQLMTNPVFLAESMSGYNENRRGILTSLENLVGCLSQIR